MAILRSGVPALLLFAGLVAATVGIGQLTWWAPSPTLTIPVSMNTLDKGKEAPLIVITARALDNLADGATVTVKGPGKLILAEGRADDVEAWVGKTANVSITGLDSDASTAQTRYLDEGGPKANPRGSDLWLKEEYASNELTYRWQAPDQWGWALLLASDGSQAAATEVFFTVPNNRAAPWAIPLIIIGMTLALVAVVLWFLMRHTPKRSLNHRPVRRARRGRRARSLMIVACVLVQALTLPPPVCAQAGAQGLPAFNPHQQRLQRPTGEADLPVLSDQQLVRVLERVKEATDRADAAKDAARLDPRVGGQARQDRASNYTIRAADPNYPAREPVSDTDLLSRMVSTNRSWPRQAVAVTKGPKNQVPQLLILEQKTPRDNFLLRSTARLLAGQTLPQPQKAHLPPLPLDSGNKASVSPKDAMATVAKALEDPSTADGKPLGNSAFISATKSLQNKFREEGKEADFTFTHEVLPQSLVAFQAENKSTIVMGDLLFTVGARAKAKDTVLTLTDPASKALARGDKSTKGFDLKFNEHVAFVLPADQKEPELVAAERALVESALLSE